MKYDYIKTFVTNVKGLDKDIEYMGTTFNFAEMDGVKLDKMLKTLLFAVEFLMQTPSSTVDTTTENTSLWRLRS